MYSIGEVKEYAMQFKNIDNAIASTIAICIIALVGTIDLPSAVQHCLPALNGLPGEN